jgi:conjugal transfer pilus assembly protein TraF
MAIGVFDEQLQERRAERIRALAATHGLLFIFRSDCPYCHRFAPILKRFEQAFGMLVFPVSLDGKGLPEYPDPQPDNGTAARLNASVVPALYLTAPAKREIRPVGFGLMALSDLVERVAALAQEKPTEPL